MESIQNDNDDLNLLAAQAAQADAHQTGAEVAQAGADQQEQEQAQATSAAELSALLQIAAGLFAPLLPSVGKIYTTETCDRIAAASVPVMDKRGWNISGWMAGWGEEIALLVVVAPVALMTFSGVKKDLEAAERAAKGAEEIGAHEGEIVPEEKAEGVEHETAPRA